LSGHASYCQRTTESAWQERRWQQPRNGRGRAGAWGPRRSRGREQRRRVNEGGRGVHKMSGSVRSRGLATPWCWVRWAACSSRK
jgi:hypothetical protein